jgi:hypothetical protein
MFYELLKITPREHLEVMCNAGWDYRPVRNDINELLQLTSINTSQNLIFSVPQTLHPIYYTRAVISVTIVIAL